MNKKKIISALLFFFFVLSANAQLLWKVTGNGLSEPSYLFGTHHLIERSQIRDFDKILNLAGQTDAVVGEMDMGNMLSMEIKMLKAVMMKDSTMKQLLSDSDYFLVDKEFKQVMGKGLDKLGKMKPSMLSSVYTVFAYNKANNIKKQPEAVDILFQKKARKSKKQVIGLETIEQQIDILFNSTSLKQQAADLVKEVKEKDKEIENIQELNEAYLTGDLKKIEILSTDETEMTPEEKVLLVDNRNNNWIKQLTVLLPQKSCFVAVGCMHLVGEVGLIKQLRKAGYTVEGVEAL
jgi:uncharacterized protein YbaP (TraB family)